MTAMALESTPGYFDVQRAFLREDFAVVTALAHTFLEEHPEAPEVPRVRLWLVLSLDRLQRSDEALEALDGFRAELRAEHPLWPEVLFWDGEVSRRAFQMIRARQAFQELLARFPDSNWTSQAQFGMGLIDLNQGAFESAIGHFHEITVRQPGTTAAVDAQLFVGLCHVRLRQFAEAVTALEPLLTQLSDPGRLNQAAFYLGEAFSGLGRYGEASSAYQRAISDTPTSQWGVLARFGLGWARYRLALHQDGAGLAPPQNGAGLDQCRESVESFEAYLQHGRADHRTEALFAQGSCLLRLGNEPEALMRFEQIVSRDVQHPLAVDSALILADAYRRQERPALAKELLHTLLRRPLEPAARGQVQLRLGSIALGQGKAAQARTIFALAADGTTPSIRQAALSGLGDVQLFLGQPEAAKALYEGAIRLALPQDGAGLALPQDGAGLAAEAAQTDYATYQVGRIHLQEGEVEQAIPIFQDLVAHAEPPLADDARLALVIAYLNARDEASARVLLSTIRREHPSGPMAARVAYYEALLALGAEDEAAARRLCSEVIAKAPQSEEAFEARLLLGDLAARAESAAAARAWLLDLLRTQRLGRSQRAKLLKRLADFAREERDYASAIRWYDEAAELAPALGGEVSYRIASCYEESGDLELAIDWYRQAAQRPWRVRGQLAAAKLLERQDRADEAEAIYRMLVDEPIPEAKVVQERLAALREERSVEQ